MDKQDNGISNYSHGISLFERKNLVITGVKKIDNFGDALKNKFEGFNPLDVFGADFNEEDLAKLSGLLDKLK